MDLLTFRSTTERCAFFIDKIQNEKDALEHLISTDKKWLDALDFSERTGPLKVISDKEVYTHPGLVLLKSKYISKPRALWWAHPKRCHLLQSSELLTSYFVNEVLFYQGWLYGQSQKSDDVMMTPQELIDILTLFNQSSHLPYINPRILVSLFSGLHYRFEITRAEQNQVLDAVIGIKDTLWRSEDLPYIHQNSFHHEIHPDISAYLSMKNHAFEAFSCREEVELLLS